MQTISWLTVFAVLFHAGKSAADEIPTPSVTQIDYERPEKYLELHESFGDGARIRGVAATLKAAKAEQTLLAINRWMDKNLDYDASAAYEWRDFDAAVDGRCYGGCADYAVVFAALRGLVAFRPCS